MEVARYHQNDQDLHELAGLKVERPDGDPAIGPARRGEHEHQRQGRQTTDVQHRGDAFEMPVVDGGHQDAEQEAHDNPVDLRHVNVGKSRAMVRPQVGAGRAVEVDDAQRGHGHDGDQQRHVDLRAAAKRN